MKMIKSLVLGSAAGLIAMSGAQAADLPLKAKAVEYVKVCSLYGAGFYYIPGTDTCIKLGGYVRIDTTFNGQIYGGPAWSGDLGQGSRYADYYTSRSRAAFTIDTRTATEYGVVRTFSQADFQFSTIGGGGNSGGYNPNSLATNLGGNSQLLDTPGGGYTAVEFVFIQFAGFTFGKSASAYATPWQGYPGNNNSFLLGGHDTVTGVNNIQYTAQFGNGVSGTIGLDDPVVFNRTSVYNLNNGIAGNGGLTLSGAGGISSNAYAGVRAPDLVGNIRVDQAWGLFQLSGALHEVSGSYYNLGTAGPPASPAGPNNLSELSGNPTTKYGGSVMAALQIKNLPTGPGDDLKIDATYARGDTKNVISTSSASPNFLMYGNASLSGGNNNGIRSLGFGATTDGIYTPGGAIELTEAYGVRGAFNHNWSPFWSSSLFGSYSAVRYNGNATAAYCNTYGAGVAGRNVTYTCNPDFNAMQIGLVTRWTPVRNLTFSAELQYFRLDQNFTGSATLTPAGPKPAATVYQYRDQDTILLNVRAQRNF